MKKPCYIVSYGYDPPYPKFRSVKEALQELNRRKKEDLKNCKKRFGTAKVTPLKRGYIVGFGDSVWSSAYIENM